MQGSKATPGDANLITGRKSWEPVKDLKPETMLTCTQRGVTLTLALGGRLGIGEGPEASLLFPAVVSFLCPLFTRKLVAPEQLHPTPKGEDVLSLQAR